MPSLADKPLWTCPACGHQFVTRRIYHSCGRFSADALFGRCEPHVRATFERITEAAHACGPVRVYAQKTRMVIQARIRFVGAQPQKRKLLVHLLLPSDVKTTRATKRVRMGSYDICFMEFASEAHVDAHIKRLIAKAYAIGCQDHLRERSIDEPASRSART